jgi:hypothetical protein
MLYIYTGPDIGSDTGEFTILVRIRLSKTPMADKDKALSEALHYLRGIHRADLIPNMRLREAACMGEGVVYTTVSEDGKVVRLGKLAKRAEKEEELEEDTNDTYLDDEDYSPINTRSSEAEVRCFVCDGPVDPGQYLCNTPGCMNSKLFDSKDKEL